MNPWSIAGIVLAVIIGVFLPLQALINAHLGRATSGPLFASFASFLIGTLSLGGLLLVIRSPAPSVQMLGSVSGWAWLGGVIGAVYVFSATLLVPRLGAASMICLVVFGQIVGSLLLDHYGVLASARPVDAMRLLGAMLVLVGAILVVQPWQGR